MILFNPFFKSQFIIIFFCYGICNSQTSENKALPELLQELLDKDKFASIHPRNFQTMTIVTLKVTKDLAQDNKKKINYILRHFSNFIMPLVNSVYNGTATVSSQAEKYVTWHTQK